MINNYLGNQKLAILNEYLHILVIVLFQSFGTLIFAYCTYNMVNLKSQGNSIYLKIVFFFLDFSLSMMLVASYSRQFSGGLFNPAVSFFRIFRKTERYPVKIAILYMICQFLGSIVGCFLALYVNNVNHAPITTYLPWKIQIQHIVTNALGTMVLTFMVQLVSEKKMTYIQHNREFYIVLPLYYLIARSYSSKSNGVNPAFGVGFELVYCFKHGNWGIFYQTYIFLVGPFLGALLACVLFEYGMRPMYPMKKEAVIEATVRMKKAKQEIQLKIAPAKALNNRWSLNEVVNQQKYAPIGNEYQFVAIAEEDIDDEINSLSDQDYQDDILSLATELQRSIRKSEIITNQFANKPLANLLHRRSLYRPNVRAGNNETTQNANPDLERKDTVFKSVVNYSIMDNSSIQEAYERENDAL